MRAVEVLPTPRGAAEEEGVRDAVLLDGVAEGAGDVFLPDDLVEVFGAPLPGQDDVRHGLTRFLN